MGRHQRTKPTILENWFQTLGSVMTTTQGPNDQFCILYRPEPTNVQLLTPEQHSQDFNYIILKRLAKIK